MTNDIQKQSDQFHRLELIVGSRGLHALNCAKIIIFGIGGVGSWAAEALVRSGICHITIVDSDTICITNINRQIQATHHSIGQSKVEVLKNRLLDINPRSSITTCEVHYNHKSAALFNLSDYDYVIDAIDTLNSKIELISNAVKSDAKLFSSLGAARRLDPTRIRVDDIWQTRGCRLGHFVRKRLRKRGIRNHFKCVYSDELMPIPSEFLSEVNPDIPNGSAAHVTGCFGFHLCSLVIQDIMKPLKEVRPLS